VTVLLLNLDGGNLFFFLTVSNRGLALLADFRLLLAGFYFIQELDPAALADRAGASSLPNELVYSVTSMCFRHEYLACFSSLYYIPFRGERVKAAGSAPKIGENRPVYAENAERTLTELIRGG
jgi:hypothetical protein